MIDEQQLTPIERLRRQRGEPLASVTSLTSPKPASIDVASVELPTSASLAPMRVGTVELAAQPSRGRVVETRAITSAASVMRTDPRVDASAQKASSYNRIWQSQVWGYYDIVGELHYPMTFIASCGSRLSLYLAHVDDDGKTTAVFDDEGNTVEGISQTEAEYALSVLNDLKGPVGGQSELLRMLFLNLSMVGEAQLCGFDDPLIGAQGRVWEVLSTEELKPAAKGYRRFRGPGDTGIEIPDSQAYVARIWRQHPRWSYVADSSVRPLVDVLEQLVLLTQQGRAEALSRLAGAGLLLMPKEITDAYQSDTNANDESEEGDPFTRDLVRTMTTPIRDKGSAAAFVPFVVAAAAEFIKEVRLVTFASTEDSKGIEKRKELVLRLAQGLDLPVEVLQGVADVNHWGAWQIDESTYKAHIEPLAELAVDGLTRAYLHAHLGPATPFVIGFDPADLVSHPNRAADYFKAHDAFAISDKSLRDAIGATDDDAPDEEEIGRRIRIQQLIKVRETVQGLLPASADKPSALDPGNVTVGAPNAGAVGSPAPSAAGATIAAAAEVAISRAVRRAGTKLRTKSKTVDLTGVSDYDVAAALGPTLVRQHFPTEAALFAGEFIDLARWCSETFGAEVARCTIERVEALAVDRLYAPRARTRSEEFDHGTASLHA